MAGLTKISSHPMVSGMVPHPLQQEMRQVAEQVTDALLRLYGDSKIPREEQIRHIEQSFCLPCTPAKKSEVERIWNDLTLYLEIPDESPLVTKYLSFSGYKTLNGANIVEL
jgi:hypothetical protein